jgi:hypothetical protein
LPDATPTSTAPRSPARRNKLWIAVQLLLTAVILWFVGRKLVEQWHDFRNVPLTVHPRWGMLVLSALVVLVTYAVLIETWRRMVMAWGDPFPFRDAAEIWFIQSLVRYLPWNFVFQLPAIAELSRRRNVSPSAATAAAVINVVVNIASGFAIALAAGFGALDTLSNGHATVGLAVAIAAFVGLLVLPALVVPLLTLLKRLTGRDIALVALPRRTIYIAIVGNVVAWVLYGVAYRLLVVGVIGQANGSWADYIAVYAAAYVIGYLVFALPAGAGVREGVQLDALPLLGMATLPQAAVIAVASRLMLTILEIVPGLFFLARGTRLRSPAATTPTDGSNE